MRNLAENLRHVLNLAHGAGPGWSLRHSTLSLLVVAVAAICGAPASAQTDLETIQRQQKELAAVKGELQASEQKATAAEQKAATAEQKINEAEKKHAETDHGLRRLVVAASYLLVGGVAVALLVFMARLRNQLAASQDSETRKLFPHMALGLPDGSVRAGLAILIVLGSLLSLMGAVFPELNIKAPEALTGVFGTILGFYFGRSGGAEIALTGQAMATVAHAGASGAIADARQQTQKAQEQAATSERSQADTLVAHVEPLLAAAAAVVAAAPAAAQPALKEELAKARTAIEAANASNKLEQINAAIGGLTSQGPVAIMIRELGPALAPLTPTGTTLAALRALADTTAQLPPAVAQRWSARLQALPYREDWLPASIDDDYAKRLLGGVADAPALLKFLQDHPPRDAIAGFSPLNEIAFVKAVLRENAAGTIKDIWGEGLPANAEGTIEAMQRRALEIQLESEIAGKLIEPYGGFDVFWKALDTVQSASDGSGLRALDLFLTLVKAARQAGIATAELLP